MMQSLHLHTLSPHCYLPCYVISARKPFLGSSGLGMGVTLLCNRVCVCPSFDCDSESRGCLKHFCFRHFSEFLHVLTATLLNNKWMKGCFLLHSWSFLKLQLLRNKCLLSYLCIYMMSTSAQFSPKWNRKIGLKENYLAEMSRP